MSHEDSSRKPAPRRTLATVAKVGGGLVALLVLLVVMLPTLVSWGLFRGTVTGTIQGSVNGTVTLGELQLGWGGPIVARNLRIEDAEHHTSMDTTLTLDQGLWTLLVDGIGSLSGSVSAKVSTRVMPDGSLGIAHLARAASSAAGDREPRDAARDKGGPLPAGFKGRLVLESLDLAVEDQSGAPMAAVTGLKGEVALEAGAAATMRLAGDASYLDNRGSFSITLDSKGIIARDGSLALSGVPLTVDATATSLQFSAQGTRIALDSAAVKVQSKDLQGATEVSVKATGKVDGAAEASSLEVALATERTLAADGSLAVNLGGLRGSVAGRNVPTAPLERFLQGTPVVLSRDVGPTVDVQANFADASGKGLSLELTSRDVSLRASGSVNMDTQAATLDSVELKARVHPALAEVGGVGLTSPASLELRAQGVTVPARDAEGSFPIGALAFKANASIAMPGASVQVAGGRRALNVSALQLDAQASPVQSGVAFKLAATPATGAAAPAQGGDGGSDMRIEGTLAPGGQFGVHGHVLAAGIPTALVDPWLPESVPLKASEELGARIVGVKLEVGEGEEAPLELDMRSDNIHVSVSAVRSSGGSLRVPKASLVATRVRPEMLRPWGVDVDAPLRVDVTATNLHTASMAPFNVGEVHGVLEARVAPATGGAFALRTPGRETPLQVQSVSLRAGGDSPLAQRAVFDATVLSEGTTVRVNGTASGVFDAAGALAYETASYDATAAVQALTAGQVGREVPALKDIAAAFGNGTFGLQASYKGTLRDGALQGMLESGAAKATFAGALTATAANARLEATIPVTRALLNAASSDLPVVLGAPAVASVRVTEVALARDGLWGFAAPSNATYEVRVPELSLREVEGLSGSIKLSGVALDGQVGLAAPMRARGSLRTEVAALGNRNQVTRAADVAADWEWSKGAAPAAAAAGAADASAPGAADASAPAPQTWSVQARLENLNGAGLEEILGVPASSRGQIGNGGTAALKATQSPSGALAFELDSKVDRLQAAVRGDLTDGVLTLQPSTLDLNLNGPQVVALLNGMNDDNARTWKESEPLALAATVQSFRMRLGAAEPKGSADAAPAVQLPEGFAAVASAKVQPLTLTPTDGLPVRLTAADFTVSAPGVGQPATVSGKVVLAPQAGAAARTPASAQAPASAQGAPAAPTNAEIVLNATLNDWTTPSGAVAFDTMRVNGRVTATRANTAVLGALLGEGNDLVEALGPEVTADARLTSTGPGEGTINASVDSEFLWMRAPRITMKGGFVEVSEDKPVTMKFHPSEPLRERLLEPINPVFSDVRLATEGQRIVLTVPSVRYPLDGDYRKLNADLQLTVGSVLMQRNADNQLLNMLKVFESREGKPVDGLIDPLVVQVRRGQLGYQNFNIYLEKQGNTWVTQLIFSGDIDLTRTPPFARSIAANYPMSSLARQFLSNVPNADGGAEVQQVLGLATGALGMVQLRITFSGPLGEVNGKPMELKRKVKVDVKPEAIGQGIGDFLKGAGDGLRDLFDKKKQQ